MIRNYFKLQFRIIQRQVKDIGFPAFLIYPAIFVFYIVLYHFLQLYPTWAAYLVFLINFQSLFNLSDFKRNDFLKATYSHKDYSLIRITENVILSVGTIILFILTSNAALACIIIALSILFVFIPTSGFWSRSIPTPFRKFPFEFIIGFRKTWLLIFLLYILSAIAVVFKNQNLALFCMFCICVCSTFFYQMPEPFLIFWNQNRKPLHFLWYKILRGIIQLSILLLPIILMQFIVFREEIYKAVIVWALGLLLIPFIISLKYAAFPRKINSSEGIIIALCLTFYPLVLAIIPYYYFKAINNLKNLL